MLFTKMKGHYDPPKSVNGLFLIHLMDFLFLNRNKKNESKEGLSRFKK